MSETPENEAHDQHDETPAVPDPAQDPMGSFDAFRARRAEEQAANESFPKEHGTRQYEPGQFEQRRFEAGQYTAPHYESATPYEPTAYEPTQYAQPFPEAQSETGGRARGRLRSVAVLGGAVVLVAGVVGGVYAATRSSGGPASASAGVTASQSASPSAGPSKGTKNGKAVIARLTVTSVGADSFSATSADGQSVTVQVTDKTKFGTAARPFTRSQLVAGVVVLARLRHEADGTVVATVIASATADKSGSGSAGASASPSATAGV